MNHPSCTLGVIPEGMNFEISFYKKVRLHSRFVYIRSFTNGVSFSHPVPKPLENILMYKGVIKLKSSHEKEYKNKGWVHLTLSWRLMQSYSVLVCSWTSGLIYFIEMEEIGGQTWTCRVLLERLLLGFLVNILIPVFVIFSIFGYENLSNIVFVIP